jgi:hypothetical protein
MNAEAIDTIQKDLAAAEAAEEVATEIDLSKDTSNAPATEADKLIDNDEALIREWGKRRNALDSLQKLLKFNLWDRYKRRDVFLAKCKTYYRDLLAQGALTQEQYSVYYHFSEHYRVPEKNLTEEQLKEKNDYNTRRTALVRKMDKMLSKFCDDIFGLEPPKTPAKEEEDKSKRIKSSAKKTPATAESKEEPKTEPVAVEEPLRQMADLSMKDEVKPEELQAEEPKQEEPKQEATEAAQNNTTHRTKKTTMKNKDSIGKRIRMR